MSALGLAELADRVRLEPDGWFVVVAVDESQIDSTAHDLAEELTYLLEEEGVGTLHVFAERPVEPTLVEEIAGLRPDDVALLPLTADVVDSVSGALDYGRIRLVGGPRGVLVTSEAGVRILAAKAPNFWSWVGPRVWSIDPRAGHLDSDARLASLRQGTGLTDAEVIERAEAGTLEPDPVFSEWLVLLGKGDLLGR